jgi:hypothetical protein
MTRAQAAEAYRHLKQMEATASSAEEKAQIHRLLVEAYKAFQGVAGPQQLSPVARREAATQQEIIDSAARTKAFNNEVTRDGKGYLGNEINSSVWTDPKTGNVWYYANGGWTKGYDAEAYTGARDTAALEHARKTALDTAYDKAVSDARRAWDVQNKSALNPAMADSKWATALHMNKDLDKDTWLKNNASVFDEAKWLEENKNEYEKARDEAREKRRQRGESWHEDVWKRDHLKKKAAEELGDNEDYKEAKKQHTMFEPSSIIGKALRNRPRMVDTAVRATPEMVTAMHRKY